MAESAFAVFHSAKEYLMDGTLDLDTQTFHMALFLSAAAMSAGLLATVTSLGSIASQLGSGNGYSSSGFALSGVTWATGASSGERRFDASDMVLTASGGDWSDVKFAVIHQAGKLLCYSQLSTGGFDITNGNTLTIQFASGGIFELN